MSEIVSTYYKSKSIGYLKITGSDAGIQAINFIDGETVSETETPASLQTCVRQLDEYFAGERQKFSVQLDPRGTDFQLSVWRELINIPCGRTASYLEIARAIGNEKAIRAVGAANGSNKIPIIIPCHRVIGSDGSLVGFGGGLWRKELLLRHEGAIFV